MTLSTKILNKKFVIYVLKFGVAFCLLYFGTLAVIGLSTPEGYYSPFIAKYLDYISVLRNLLLHTSKGLLSLFNYNTTIKDKYTLRGYSGGIRMVYSCIGYGVMSFWAAFIMGNNGSSKKKLVWISAGLLSLFCINVLRLSLLIIAIDKHWPMPLRLDHHTWFNIIAYLLIFFMIYLYDR